MHARREPVAPFSVPRRALLRAVSLALAACTEVRPHSLGERVADAGEDVALTGDDACPARGCDVATLPRNVPGSGLPCGEGRAPCPAGEFCELATSLGGSGCNGSPQRGLCVSGTTSCGRATSPVCGCDLVSYASPCEAHGAGVSMLHDGLCTVDECLAAGGTPQRADGLPPPCARAGGGYPVAARDVTFCCP